MISDEILVGLLALFSAVVGSSLQYFYSKKSKAIDYQLKLKTEAYVDFLNSIAGIAIAQKYKESEKEKESKVLLTDAKARIAIYGSKEVAELVANFFGGKAILDNPESINSFIDACQAMRRDSLPPDQSISNEDIFKLIFK